MFFSSSNFADWFFITCNVCLKLEGSFYSKTGINIRAIVSWTIAYIHPDVGLNFTIGVKRLLKTNSDVTSVLVCISAYFVALVAYAAVRRWPWIRIIFVLAHILSKIKVKVTQTYVWLADKVIIIMPVYFCFCPKMVRRGLRIVHTSVGVMNIFSGKKIVI